MIICEIPYWFENVVKWTENNLLDKEVLLDALNWLVIKGIVVCEKEIDSILL